MQRCVRSLFVLFVSLWSSIAFAQVRIAPIVIKEVGMDGELSVSDAVRAKDGSFITVGSINNSGARDILVKKLDGQGKLLWSATYGKLSSDDWGISLALAADGSIYINGATSVTVTQQGVIFADLTTLKYDKEGNLVWAKTIVNGSYYDKNTTLPIITDRASNAYIVAQVKNANYDYVTIKYNPNGSEAWRAIFNSGGDDIAQALALDSGGNVYVTGASARAGQDDIVTVKYDGNGDEVWSDRYDNVSRADVGAAIAVDSSGNTYVAGNSTGLLSGLDAVVLKYDTDGFRSWVSRYNGPGNGEDRGYRIAVDTEGNPILAGSASGSNRDFLIAKINPDSGNRLWTVRYNGPKNQEDILGRILLDEMGSIYVSGWTRQSGSSVPTDNHVIKINSAGNVLWAGSLTLTEATQGLVGGQTLDVQGNIYAVGAYRNQNQIYVPLLLRYSPFQAQDIALGQDEKLRLLTSRSDNQAAQVRLIASATGQVERINTIPSPPDCTPQAITTAPNNKTYILWQRTDGQAQLYQYNADLSIIERRVVFGPIGKQRPVDIACGLDNKVRLSWRGTDVSNRQTLYLWTLSPNLAIESQGVLPPFGATQMAGLTVGRDNRARVFWATTTNRTLGKNYLSTVNASNAAYASWSAYGPYGGLIGQDAGLSLDNKVRLLWRGVNGGAHLYRLNLTGTAIEKDFTLSPPVDQAFPLQIGASVSTLSQWVLWTYPDGRCLARNVNPSSGQIQASFLYWPF